MRGKGRWSGVLLATAVSALAAASGASAAGPGPASGKIHPWLQRALAAGGISEGVKVWILFRPDKGVAGAAALEEALAALEARYDPRAIERRRLRRTRPGLFDVDDLRLPAEWLEAARATGAELLLESRWVSGVSARATGEQIERLAELEFVTEVRPVLRARTRSAALPPEGVDGSSTGSADADPGHYGVSWDQLSQIRTTDLHDLGLTGAGVRIGVLDTGYRTSHLAFNGAEHPLSVVAEWDFVNDDPVTGPELGDELTQHEHGTLILGTLASYWPGTLVGGAYEAEYILAKVEDVASEYPLEEDWFVAGLEFIESNGGDLATSSVVIFDHYPQEENDGRTSVMARGVNAATDNGLHVFQGVGNNGHDSDPATSTMVTPADAFEAITVGSVDRDGTLAWFTSDGPTADGRVKPEIMARGVDTHTVSPWNDSQTTTANGASLATPLVAGAAACLLQAHPDWTVEELRTHFFLHGDYYLENGRSDPLVIQGFGILDVRAAYDRDCNANGVEDPLDLAEGRSGDCNGNGIADECDVAALTSADEAEDGLPDECEECLTGPGCPAEVPELLLSKQAPDLLLAWQSAESASTYSIRRDQTAAGAGSTEVGSVPAPGLSWLDENALVDPPELAFYLVRGVTAGGVAGP